MAGAGPERSDPRGELLAVGRVAKPHGLVGEVVVEQWTDVPGRFHPGARFSTSRGATLVVETARAHQHRWLVGFEGVVDREGAERLRGCELLAPPVATPTGDELWVHQLIGCRLLDHQGRELGTVEAVEANPASDLLVITGGALVPVRFVVDHQPGVSVTVDVPEGLLDLGTPGEPSSRRERAPSLKKRGGRRKAGAGQRGAESGGHAAAGAGESSADGDGADGVDGVDGSYGHDGADGADGSYGHDGADGVDGADSVDGSDGADGHGGHVGHGGDGAS